MTRWFLPMPVCCSSVLILKSILSKAMWRVCCFVKRLAPVDIRWPTLSRQQNRQTTADFGGLLWTKKRDFELEMDVGGHPWTGNAGGEIRTLNPLRGLVFETSAYTVPPHRLVRCMIPHHMQEVNMLHSKMQARSRISQFS